MLVLKCLKALKCLFFSSFSSFTFRVRPQLRVRRLSDPAQAVLFTQDMKKIRHSKSAVAILFNTAFGQPTPASQHHWRLCGPFCQMWLRLCLTLGKQRLSEFFTRICTQTPSNIYKKLATVSTCLKKRKITEQNFCHRRPASVWTVLIQQTMQCKRWIKHVELKHLGFWPLSRFAWSP